jgi:hypothetical protein
MFKGVGHELGALARGWGERQKKECQDGLLRWMHCRGRGLVLYYFGVVLGKAAAWATGILMSALCE